MRRRLLIVALVIGLGLVAAPAVFQMFSRAPKGGRMMDGFRPYMTAAQVHKYQGYMAEIDAADAELTTKLPTLLQSRSGIGVDEAAKRFASLSTFEQQWPHIKADMNDDMLATIERMLPNYRAVDALPAFPLFPWFFVGPGVIVAALAAIALWRERRDHSNRGLIVAVGVMGIGIILAPAVFQMFTRAPQGADMIDAFRPIMTRPRVTTVQGYFLTIGVGEGELRNQVRPFLVQSGMTDEQLATELPAVERFSHDWPKISNDFAPMIGTMSNNLDNFAAVKALPPFWLFPWFFVVPGLLIAACGLAAARRPVPLGAVATTIFPPEGIEPARAVRPAEQEMT